MNQRKLSQTYSYQKFQKNQQILYNHPTKYAQYLTQKVHQKPQKNNVILTKQQKFKKEQLPPMKYKKFKKNQNKQNINSINMVKQQLFDNSSIYYQKIQNNKKINQTVIKTQTSQEMIISERYSQRLYNQKSNHRIVGHHSWLQKKKIIGNQQENKSQLRATLDLGNRNKIQQMHHFMDRLKYQRLNNGAEKDKRQHQDESYTPRMIQSKRIQPEIDNYMEKSLAVGPREQKHKKNSKTGQLPLKFSLSTQLPKKSFQQVLKKIKITDFKLGQCKGQGRFGKVYQAIHIKTGFLCAIKKIAKQSIKYILEQFIQEIKIQLYLHHPNLVKLYGFFVDQDSIYLIMEYMEDGSLYHLIKKQKMLNQKQSIIKLIQIAHGINYMHQQSIVHRDLKPQNVVLSHNVCKICDFGWAAHCLGRRTTYCGTLDYVSPQVLEGESYDLSVDIWCFGVLAYQMLSGKAPFYNISRQETMKKIKQCQLSFPKQMSKQAKNFINTILKKKPTQRTGITQILNSNFLKEQEYNPFKE